MQLTNIENSISHNNDDLISVIMAAYNAEKTIKNSIESVLKQTIANWELIIVDDCSTDRTAKIAYDFTLRDSRVRLLSNSQNSGVSVTRKKGLLEARGAWIAILDSDDMWSAEKLEKQMNLQKETKAELIYTGSAFINSDGVPVDWYLHAPLTITYKQLLKQNLISNSSVLVKKEIYLKYYASGDSMHEDFATWLRILRANVKVRGVDEPLLIYRLTKTSKSGNKIHSAKMQLNTYRYIGLNPIMSGYYMCWYMIRGWLKYRNLR